MAIALSVEVGGHRILCTYAMVLASYADRSRWHSHGGCAFHY